MIVSDEYDTERFLALIDSVQNSEDPHKALENLQHLGQVMENKLPDNMLVWPNEFLGQKCIEINNDELAKTIISKLNNTLITDGGKYIGVGLSANQIGYPFRVCIIRHNDPPIDLDLINPRIIDHSTSSITKNESCLSIPGVEFMIRRYVWITIEADNLSEPIQIDHIPVARAVQHEIDHLDGLTIFDRKLMKINKVGRNERCPCGSGLKYKKCCLLNDGR